MNVNESAKIKKIFQNLGYDVTEETDDADAVFLNTCTVREGAATQIFGKLGELKSLKEKKGTIIGVTGCFAQEQGEELVKKFPIIDIVMGNQNIGRIPQAIEKIENNESSHEVYTDNEDELPPRLDAEFASDQTASISITYGCNNFCTFCIVPYVRGRERSVPLEEIVKDVEQYVNKGAKEIVLLGQNVNSYGKDFKNGDNFAKLLEEICKVEGDYIVRFDKIKSKIPDVALTADIIVGFPGETEEDFLDTVDVVEKVSFDNSYMFMYSIRKGTKAATMDNQIDENVKKERLQRLMKVQNECSFNESSKYKDKVVRVLVEGPSKKNKEVLSGRTSTNKIVLFKGDTALKGQFVDVKINECKTWTLYGDIV